MKTKTRKRILRRRKDQRINKTERERSIATSGEETSEEEMTVLEKDQAMRGVALGRNIAVIDTEIETRNPVQERTTRNIIEMMNQEKPRSEENTGKKKSQRKCPSVKERSIKTRGTAAIRTSCFCFITNRTKFI